MKSSHAKLSMSRFSLNSVFRRHSRTSSLPEPSILQGSLSKSSSAVSIVSVDQLLQDGEKLLDVAQCSNDESAAASLPGASGRQREARPTATMKAERLCSRLGLAKHEKVLKAFPCFLVSDLLVQGCLIITERHLCFYSNIFGLKKSKMISLEEIVHVSKEKVYALFPTGIEVRTRTERVVFSSATSRDKLVKLINEQCQRSPADAHRAFDLDILASIPGASESPETAGTVSSELLASEEPAEQSVDAGPGLPPAGPTQFPTTGHISAEVSDRSVAVSVESASSTREGGRKSAISPAAALLAAARKSVVCAVAITLALCVAAAIYQAYRLSQLQDQVTQVIATMHGTSIFDDQFSQEITKVIGAVKVLEDSLLHMRDLLMRMLTGGTSHDRS